MKKTLVVLIILMPILLSAQTKIDTTINIADTLKLHFNGSIDDCQILKHPDQLCDSYLAKTGSGCNYICKPFRVHKQKDTALFCIGQDTVLLAFSIVYPNGIEVKYVSGGISIKSNPGVKKRYEITTLPGHLLKRESFNEETFVSYNQFEQGAYLLSIFANNKLIYLHDFFKIDYDNSKQQF